MTNYQLGAALERTVRERLTWLGYESVRAAGSRGIADVWAARARDGGGSDLLLVQCKTNGRINHLERLMLTATARSVGAQGVLAHLAAGRGLVLEDADTREELWQR